MRVTSSLATVAKAVSTVVLGTFLIALVGERFTAYYSDLRSAADVRDQLADQVLTVSSQEAEALLVLSSDLSPHSYIVSRCNARPPDLPATLAPYRQTCRDAAIGELLEEQELLLDIRSTHLQGEVLEKSLSSALEDDAPAAKFATLLAALEALRTLSSSACGRARDNAVAKLRVYPWFTDERATKLVGPRAASNGPCDDHGRHFAREADFVARGLAFEGDVVRSEVLSSSVRGHTDSHAELVKSVVTDYLLWGLLMVGVVAWLFVAMLTRRTDEVVKRRAEDRARS